MRKAIVVSVAVLAAALLSLWRILLAGPSKDPLGEKLRGFGFLPIQPPSTLVGVGSLYYVSPDLGNLPQSATPTKPTSAAT